MHSISMEQLSRVCMCSLVFIAFQTDIDSSANDNMNIEDKSGGNGLIGFSTRNYMLSNGDDRHLPHGGSSAYIGARHSRTRKWD